MLSGASELLGALQIPPDELRGLGIRDSKINSCLIHTDYSSMVLQVSKLDNDPAAQASRPGASAPAKLSAPPRTAFNPNRSPGFWNIDGGPQASAFTVEAEAQRPAAPASAVPTSGLTPKRALGGIPSLWSPASRQSPVVRPSPTVGGQLPAGPKSGSRPPVSSAGLEAEVVPRALRGSLEDGNLLNPVNASVPGSAGVADGAAVRTSAPGEGSNVSSLGPGGRIKGGLGRGGFADLPSSMSELDPEVMAAMPPEYRREVEAFYGEKSVCIQKICLLVVGLGVHLLFRCCVSHAASAGFRAKPAHQPGGKALNGAAASAAASKRGRATVAQQIDLGNNKRPAIHQHVQQQQRNGIEPRPTAAPPVIRGSMADGLLTASQLDPSVLAEIPEDIRVELLHDLREAERLRRPQAGALRLGNSRQCDREPPATNSLNHAPQTAYLPQAEAAKSAVGWSGGLVGFFRGGTGAALTPYDSVLFSNGKEPSTVRAAIKRWFESQYHQPKRQLSDVTSDLHHTKSSQDNSNSSDLMILAPDIGRFLDSCATWLISIDDRLDELSKGLGVLTRLGAKHDQSQACSDACERVQQHLLAKFGIRLV